MARAITNGKVWEKAKKHTVEDTGRNGVYRVTSSSGGTYLYNVHFSTCTCRRQKFVKYGAPNYCSHGQAALKHHQAKNGVRATVRLTSDDISQLHRKSQILGDGVKVTLRTS